MTPQPVTQEGLLIVRYIDMIKKQIVIIVFILSFSTNFSVAQQYIIKSYEDCILENMKGVKSDAAALEIKKACKKKIFEYKKIASRCIR